VKKPVKRIQIKKLRDLGSLLDHSAVQPCPNTGCWLWMGASGGSRGGYGIITVDGRGRYAHRFSWEITNGPIPAGMFVCHRCNVPCCVNPDHLFLGTSADNMRHMVECGRGTTGERSYWAKLKTTEVIQIKRLLAEGQGQQAIADRFGVKQATISDIGRGRRWGHLDAIRAD
jgi:hypothetical protein